MSWSLAAARELPDMELGGTRQRDRDAESSLSGRRRGMREQYLRQSSMLPLPRSQHPAVSSVAAPVSVNGILSRPPRAPTAFSSQRRQDLYDPWGAFDSLEDMDVPPRGDPIGLRSRSSLFRNRTSAPNTTPTAGTPSRRPPGPPPPPPRPSGSQPILESGPSRVEWSTFGVSLIWDDLAQRKTDMEEEHIKQTGTSDSLATTQSHDQQARPATSLSAHSKDPFDCLSVGFGGNRWHVALIHPTTLSPDSEAPVPTNPDHLVLYLSCGLLELDYPHNDVTVPAVVHLALFEPEHQRGAKSEPIWSIWEEFTFASPDEEYFQCLFPTITELFAQSSAIRAKNSAILHVQIQSPRRAPALSAQASGLTTAPRFMDSVRLPHESLAGLGALLDEPNTGDVRIYVHERMPDHLLPDKRQPLYRKRVLLGHSAILRARSSFFKSMLDNDSEWTEAAVEIEESTGRRRRVHHVALNVEFATMFHLLRWLYKDCIVFAEDNDAVAPEELPDGVVEASDHTSAGCLGWEWQSLQTLHAPLERAEGRAEALSPVQRFSSSSKGKSAASGTSIPRGVGGETDPHEHPCVDDPAPPSALSVYALGHFANLGGLCRLAQDHLVSRLTPSTAFPLLLSTHLFEGLHAAITSYTLDHWTEVRSTSSYERTLAEISSGCWPDNDTLLQFTKLLSPTDTATPDRPTSRTPFS